MDNNTIQPDNSVAEEPLHGNPPSSDITKDTNFLSLKGFFNIDDPSLVEEEALNWIYEQFDKMGAVNMAEVLWGLKEIERKMGIGTIGESRVISVRNYLKINAQIADLESQKDAIER